MVALRSSRPRSARQECLLLPLFIAEQVGPDNIVCGRAKHAQTSPPRDAELCSAGQVGAPGAPAPTRISLKKPLHVPVAEQLRSKRFECGTTLPGVEWKAGFSTGLRQERFTIPAMFDRYLRQKQAATGIQGDE
jgi:hypothetical protein